MKYIVAILQTCIYDVNWKIPIATEEQYLCTLNVLLINVHVSQTDVYSVYALL